MIGSNILPFSLCVGGGGVDGSVNDGVQRSGGGFVRDGFSGCGCGCGSDGCSYCLLCWIYYFIILNAKIKSLMFGIL